MKSFLTKLLYGYVTKQTAKDEGKHSVKGQAIPLNFILFFYLIIYDKFENHKWYVEIDTTQIL